MTQPINLPTPASQPSPQSEQKTGTTIKGGIYQMRATDSDLGYTQGSDGSPPAPQVAVLMEFVDGPYKSLTLTWYGFFTDKTKASTFRALRTLGWQGDDLSDLSTVRGEAPCTIQVDTDLQGVPRANIRFIGGGALAMKNTMSDEQKKAFAASMKAFASTVKPEEKAKEEAKEAPKGDAKGPGKFF